MHMADALVSPAVAGVAGITAMALIGVSSKKVKSIQRDEIIPLMGVMGAFIFAAQMINFSIPATGSSGHIIGGILLAALLGPWAAFITLTSVLIIQCLFFADGGLMALGCNIINMGAMSCLVAYPLVYKPFVGNSIVKWKISFGSILACVIGLELGALLVTIETKLSGVSALSTMDFLALMSSIHLVIGVCEGIATAIILCFIASYKPDLLSGHPINSSVSSNHKTRTVILIFLVIALILAGSFTWLASADPDGLEWSIEKITGSTEIGVAAIPSTALMPDYNSTFAGVVGGVIVMVMLWAICSIIFRLGRKKR